MSPPKTPTWSTCSTPRTHEVIARIKAGKRSNGVLVHPDGKRVFVTSGGKGTVQVIDTATNAIVHEDRGRQATVEHGADAGRQETLRRVRPFERRRGHRHRHVHEDREIAVGELPWGVADSL